MPTRPEIEAAAIRLAPHIRRPPVMTLARGELPGTGPVTLKLEFLQHTGSFKIRGAFNRLLTAALPTAGAVAASGGNHGAAVAYVAQRLGIPATIFVPGPTPETKVARIAAYGARVVQEGADYAAALERSRAHLATDGGLEIHAYDDPAVLAGQGTVGLELAADSAELTHVLVAVGGGGLIGGIAGYYEGSGVEVIGIEPANCPTLHEALAAGRPIPVQVGGHAADSLGARQIGGAMFEVARRVGMRVTLVSDSEIRSAQAWLWDRLRIIAEPGGAAALAGLLSGAWQPPAGSRVGVVLCGANTDPGTVSRETS